jgi:hypothetical protein
VSDLLAAADRVRGWRENPVAFVRENFGVEPDPKQTEALLKFARAQRLCLKGLQGRREDLRRSVVRLAVRVDPAARQHRRHLDLWRQPAGRSLERAGEVAREVALPHSSVRGPEDPHRPQAAPEHLVDLSSPVVEVGERRTAGQRAGGLAR